MMVSVPAPEGASGAAIRLAGEPGTAVYLPHVVIDLRL
jgi:hypothetical protein